MAKRIPKTTATEAQAGMNGQPIRVEIHCATCDPCVFITTVPASGNGQPDQDALMNAILAAGWKVNRANQTICPDCR